MCEFLKSDTHNDVRKINELTQRVNAEKHVCDALFSVLTSLTATPSTTRMREASDLYSKMLLARSTHDYSGIEDFAHKLIGEK